MFLAFFDKNGIFAYLTLKLTLKKNIMGQYFAMETSKFIYQAPLGLQKYNLKKYILRVVGDPFLPALLYVSAYTSLITYVHTDSDRKHKLP